MALRPSREGNTEVRNAIECLLLTKGGQVRLGELRKVLEVGEDEIRATLAALQVEYGGRGAADPRGRRRVSVVHPSGVRPVRPADAPPERAGAGHPRDP